MPNQQRIPRKAFFDYTAPSPSKNLTYELFSYHNMWHLLALFKDDANPFVSEKFKSESGVLKYAVFMGEKMHFSPKRGGCDFYFKTKKGNYAGILHLYDLSIETHFSQHQNCTIGFATSSSFRKQGLTKEAVLHFIQHIFEHLAMKKILAYTLKNNQVARQFLFKIGFKEAKDSYIQEETYDYFEIEKKNQEIFSLKS